MPRGLTSPIGHRGLVDEPQGGSGGGIGEITSTDGSVVITNPTGPTTDLSVLGALDNGWALELSYGDGNGSTDDDLPVSPETETEFWIGQGMDADHAGPLGGGQVREWPTHQWLGTLRLIAQIDHAQFSGGEWGGSRLVVTVDGAETGIEIAYSDVVVDDNYQTVAGDYVVAPGSKIGLKLVTVALGDGSKLRGHFRIVGGVTEAPEGPYVQDDLTIRLETAPAITPDLDPVNVTNHGSLGTPYNYVEAPGIDPPTVETEDGIPFLHFGPGPGLLNQGQLPGSGVFAAPVAGKHAPFYVAQVLRVNDSPNSRFLLRATNGGPLQASWCLPLATSFQLVWQWAEDPSANIATVPDITVEVLNKWALYEWSWDGTTFQFFINGELVAVTNDDPTGGTPAVAFSATFLGTGDGTDMSLAALFVNKAALTVGQRAQNRNYLQGTYAALLANTP